MRIQTKIFVVFLTLITNYTCIAQTFNLQQPLVNQDVVFKEKGGLVAVEAEYFNNQTHSEIRQWYRTTKDSAAIVGRDEDANHYLNASNYSYIEVLPDTRVTHDDVIVRGENFSNKPGQLAVVSYKIKFSSPGRYYVWVRAMSTGSEDNGLHVGLNGNWPEHGQRMQWCAGRTYWMWESKQRTKEEHCGVPHKIYLEVPNAGIHDVQFSMREDGFEFDKFVLSNDINYVPIDIGPTVLLATGNLPKFDNSKPELSYYQTISRSLPGNKYIAAQEFPVEGTHFYKNGKNWMAINPKKHKKAQTSKTFNFESGRYDVIFVGVGENDGRSTFRIKLNETELGVYQPPITPVLWEEGKRFNGFWKNVKLKKGDKITIEAQVATDGTEWTRARWAGLVFTPVGQGEIVQESPSTYTFYKKNK
ncbi:hypothetical protein [Pseudotamlana carrageenivorans]|uniref:Gylcosyl hydrolase 115 C-terminal domain-containing protein n=1 Tax=Pseudotamlana carrageenivorans TaxID=2069432 RepID=A0A2I7SK99_9FLAO|nr:hypothetical protein [Tamlana carrageenivorans]AUS06307.1 hypothetical protein C1A40_13005 [Tamlana carrageenivorans]